MKYIILTICILALVAFASPANAGTIFRPVFNTGMVGYWNMQEGAGNKAYDKSGNSNHGTMTNMAEDDWVNGKMG